MHAQHPVDEVADLGGSVFVRPADCVRSDRRRRPRGAARAGRPGRRPPLRRSAQARTDSPTPTRRAPPGSSARRTSSFSVKVRSSTLVSSTTASRTCSRASPMIRSGVSRSVASSTRLRWSLVSMPSSAMTDTPCGGRRLAVPPQADRRGVIVEPEFARTMVEEPHRHRGAADVAGADEEHRSGGQTRTRLKIVVTLRGRPTVSAMDPRTPVLVGVGQLNQRVDRGEPALEPAALMAEALRRAAEDTGAPGLLDDADSIRTVALLSWRYRNPGAVVATLLGIEPADTAVSAMGGNSPQSLVNTTCLDILEGRAETVLLAGAEAWRTRMAARKDDVTLDWTVEPERRRSGSTDRRRRRHEPSGRARPRRDDAGAGVSAVRAGAPPRRRSRRPSPPSADQRAVEPVLAGRRRRTRTRGSRRPSRPR